MEEKQFKAYVLIDPNTNIPRYVGITSKSIKVRFAGHMKDIYQRPELNPHKTAWFKKLMQGGQLPEIKQIAEFDNEADMKQFEKDYIKKYKEQYNLINQTPGGDYVGFRAHDRSVILKKSTTRPIVQYNVLGEKIAEFEITEDVKREYNLKGKACSHITQCCRGKRKNAYGYIWRYKGDPFGDILANDPTSMAFNKVVQYDLNMNRIAEYDDYRSASAAIGDKSDGSNIRSVVIGNQNQCKNFYFQLEPIYVYFDQKLYENTIKNFLLVDKTQFKTSNKYSKKVLMYDLNNNFEKEFLSLSEASVYLTGTAKNRHNVRKCCDGKLIQYKNKIFKYK